MGGRSPAQTTTSGPMKAEHMQTHAPGDHGVSLILATAIAATAIVGCQHMPRADVDASRAAGEAAGLGAPVEFIVVGPEGGPLNEPVGTGATLPLNDALRRAVTTDPGLQAALARVRIAMADAEQSRLLPNPVLSVVLRWGAGKPQIEASLTQEFVEALQIPRRSSMADNKLRQAAAEVVTVAIDVASEVRERYAAAQASAELVPLLRDRLVILERLVTIAKSRLDAGEGTRSDLAMLLAQVVELRVDIDQGVLAEREERVRLARLIGEPSSDASWTLDSWTAPSAELQSEARWIERALQHRPEIQSITWRLRALGDDEALAGLTPWEGANVGADFARDNASFAGPSVSTPIPIFDMGQARRARGMAEVVEARHDLTLARRKVVEEVRVAYQTMAASTANLARIRGELIPLQESRRQLAEAAYRAGQSDVTALFLAEQDLRLSQAKAIEVERRAATALVRLERAVGGPGVASTLMTSPAPGPGARSSEPPHQRWGASAPCPGL